MFKNNITSDSPGSTASNDKSSFIKNAEEARQKRQLDKKKQQSAIIIQSFYRGYQTRKIQIDLISSELEISFIANKQLTSNQVYQLVKKYFLIDRISKHCKKNQIFLDILKYLTNQIQLNSEFKTSYVSLIISKTNYQQFIQQSNKLIDKCIQKLNDINPKDKEQIRQFEICLSFITTLSNYKHWKCFTQLVAPVEQLLKETTRSYLAKLRVLFPIFNMILNLNLQTHSLLLNKTSVNTIMSLSVQILKTLNYQSNILLSFCSNLLTVPAIVNLYHSTSCLKSEIDCDISCRIYALFSDSTTDSVTNEFLKEKDLLQAVCFLGNLCSLSDFYDLNFQFNLDNFILISNKILDYCSILNQPSNKSIDKESKSETIRWNPLFGYLKIKPSDSLGDLLTQLRFLWSHKFIILLFNDSITKNQLNSSVNSQLNQQSTTNNFKSIIKNMFDKTISLNSSNKNTNDLLQLLSHQSNAAVYRICSFYKKILTLLTEPRIEILSALSYEQEFLLGLWRFFSLYLNNSNIQIKDLCKFIEKQHPIFDLLFVLSSLLLYLLTIFDSNEIYSEQSILTKNDFKKLAFFLNYFIYELIQRDLTETNWFNTYYQLLCVIYEKFKNEHEESFWNIKEIKIKTFMSELDKNNKHSFLILEKIPWAIPLRYRIELLQNNIQKDKNQLTVDLNVRIKVRRNRIIEDGINQISNLSPTLLKSTIRVVFINEFGLNEAGIDQDGVFKEFLLDVIKKILNPQFNLFQITSEQQLYPSSCSYFIDDHLKMFEFVGKLIGKAIYEGHVIDVEFAPFFLRQIIGAYNQSINYSFLDDLATLDKDLYKNLKSIKHCDDITDLELTFTHSELHLGKLVTDELIPSGSHIKVTDENKIRYIHLLAHFKLHKQIKEQINAFNRGFKSIIKQEWLNCFTLNEIQTLISGSTVDLDLNDLKANVQYWGGFNSNHRCIKWLWEILENDFDKEERSLFLKFVTSSPKPPLLGFASLNPAFTIRSVEIDEEDGTIYDASFKGFFKTMLNIGGKESVRLPTSSTCFNLLKLPNYSKKSTLRDKLRYAIRSNSGFELS